METTLHITGMTCDHCVRQVNLALAAVPGADSVSVDLASGTARINGSAELDALLAAVTESGYQARLQPADGTAVAKAGCGCGTSGGCGSNS